MKVEKPEKVLMDQLARVWSKLDRVLVNPSWTASFSSSSAHFHESGLSDHSLVVVTVFKERKVHKRFTFLNSWIGHPDYEETVKSAWKTSKAGSPIFYFFEKLRSVKAALKQLHHSHFSHISDKVKTARMQLKVVQANFLNEPLSPKFIHEEKLAIKEFTRLKTIELSILQQRAKITHLQQTDTNSNFFFAKIAERRHLQFIGSIKDKSGVLHSSQD
ncbi:uncharacterized protein LOC141601747 [Silene latifolia]|uniref:uncharacterized protein LOC141601747 n=1 Tax=Silene latifolia TaxID=37657 RepID=UPI003D77570B